MDEKIQKVPMAVDADDRCHFFLNLCTVDITVILLQRKRVGLHEDR